MPFGSIGYVPAVRSGLVLVAGLWAAACYPDSIETLADTELVVTRFSPEVFGEDASQSADFRTYARPNVVVELRPDADDSPLAPEPGPYDAAIFAELDANLDGLGYERLTGEAAATADVFVLVGATAAAWRAWTCYPGWSYWGWWDGWGPPVGPSTGWCYPGGASVTFESGTLIIDLIDASAVNAESDDLPVVWSASINGVLERSTAGIERQIERAIDRAFAQSNYLRVRSDP